MYIFILFTCCISFILERKVPLPTFSPNKSAMMPDGRDKVTGPSSYSEFCGEDRLELGSPSASPILQPLYHPV